MNKPGNRSPPSKVKRQINPKVLYSLPLIFPISVWAFAAITLYYYGPKLVKYQEDIASIVLPILIGLFTLMTIHFVLVVRRKLKGNMKIKPQTRFAQVSFTALCILFNIIFIYLITPHISAIRFNSGPSLTWGTGQDPATGISIAWKTAASSDTRVLLGSDPNSLSEFTAPGVTSEWHKISIDGLSPGTRYFYRIPALRGDLLSFMTATLAPANFSFLFFSDTRQNDGEFVVPILPNLPQYMDNYITANSIDAAFSIVGGDFVGEGDNIATWKTWFDDISMLSNLATTRPLVIVPGNHERHNDYPGAMFSKVYPLDDRPNFYYSFNYSQLHVTVLDPWNATNGWWGDFNQAQVDWLQSDLANASGMAFKVICMHPPPIRRDGTAYDNMAFLTQLCDTHDVDAVFFGHDHEYSVNQVNGTLYLLAGVGGNLAHFVSGTGFAQVDVSTDAMAITMHWINGTSVDLGTIPA